MKLIPIISNIILPPRCGLCGGAVQTNHALCGTCWEQLVIINPPQCGICAEPLPQNIEDGQICAACIATPPNYDQHLTMFDYHSSVRKLITRYKFYNGLYLRPLMLQWMLQKISPLADDIDMVIPVPLHWRRIIKRTYHHTALLAKPIAKDIGAEYAPNLLKRVKHTPPQVGLTRKRRQKNMIGAFKTPKPNLLKNQTILLIDDVMTTGATIESCSKILRKAGADRVIILTLAKNTKNS